MVLWGLLDEGVGDWWGGDCLAKFRGRGVVVVLGVPLAGCRDSGSAPWHCVARFIGCEDSDVVVALQ